MTFNKFIEALQEIKDSGTWKNPGISVRTYIPMSEKFAAIRHIGAVVNKEIDNLLQDKNFGYDYIFLNYEIEKFFTLFEKYTGIKVSDKDKTLPNYDLIMETGAFDYIKESCKEDYCDFSKLCDRVTGIDNMAITRELMSVLTTDVVTKNMNIIKKAINGISKDKLNTLSEIHKFNNPLYKEMYDKIVSSAREEARQKHKESIAAKVVDGE